MHRLLIGTLVLAAAAASCAPVQRVAAAGGAAEPVGAAAPAADPKELAQTKVLFGDLHMHTSWSFDAFTFKTTATPDDAYNFAKGAALAHPSGGVYRLNRPLDFLAVTDHSEFIGVMAAMRDPESPLARLPVARAALDPDV